MWKTAGLADVCELIARGTAPKYTETGGILVLNQKCVRDHSIQFTQARRHNEQVKPTKPERLIREWDVLVNSTGQGTLGRVAQLREHLQQDVTVDSHVTILRPIQDLFYPPFFGYLMIALEPIFQKSGLGAGGQTELSAKRLKTEFSVTFPESKAEQQRIVAKLDAAFAEIDRAIEATALSKKNANKALVQHLHQTFSSLDEQAYQCVGDVAEHCLGKMLDKKKNKGELKPYLRNQNVRWFDVSTDDLLEMKFEAHEHERYSVRRGDLLICEGGYPGRASIWSRDEEIFIQKAIHRVRFPSQIHNVWLMYYLYYLDITDKLKQHFTGAGIQHFTGKALAKLRIPLLPADLIEKRVLTISAIHTNIEVVSQISDLKFKNLKSLKSAILAQELRPFQSEAA